MTKSMVKLDVKSMTGALVLGVCLFALSGLSAFAQTKSSTPPKNQKAPGTQQGPPPDSSEEPALGEEDPNTAPILWISSVEVLHSTHEPPLDVVRVRGIASTDGWENAELVPLTKGTPPDGMLDLAFVAQAPTNSTAPSKNPVVEAIFTLEPGHPYKGLRVHGATNRVTVKTIPGYGEAPPPPRDCTDCIGKYFVGKGESTPAGASAENVIREETLPKTLRVVKPTDGIGKFDSDPNRLTLVLDDDGKIVIAVWN